MSDVGVHFFSRLVRLLFIDGQIKSETIVLVIASKRFRIILNMIAFIVQDNPENFCREYVVMLSDISCLFTSSLASVLSRSCLAY